MSNAVIQSPTAHEKVVGFQLGREQLEEDLSRIGISRGDIILVHSDTSRLMQLTGAQWWEDAFDLLQSSIESVLGRDGTLVVPTFNYEFCRGKPYDHARTTSQVGLFTNHIRRDPRAIRSFHPIFSFAAIGPQAKSLCEDVGKSAFGKESVFDRLYRANAKLVFFDTSIESSTFIHFVEQQLNVEYRYSKYFTGKVQRNGQEYIDTFEFFVRYLERNIKTFQTPLGEKLEQAGLMRRSERGDLAILQVPAVEFERVAREMWLENSNALLAHAPDPMLHSEMLLLDRKDAGARAESKAPDAIGDSFSPKELVTRLHPLHRTLVSDGLDDALELVGEVLPPSAGYTVEVYPPTKRVWTWRVPERYIVHEAYIELQDGMRLAEFAANPLHLVSYSTPIDKVVSWSELQPHLYYSTKRPDAIPWVFKYYERDWGFCLSHEQFEKLPRDSNYRVVIRAEYRVEPEQGLRVGTATVAPEGGADEAAGEMLVLAHICHPGQSNDDASGVAVNVEVLRRLAARPLPPGSKSVRFLFGPETIGTICYLAHHEDSIPRIQGGIFVEMTGNRNGISLQRTRQDNHLLDRIAQKVLSSRYGNFNQGAFREVIRNDEMVVNGPGVDVPCISLSRWPYPEYHTSDDNPSIISNEMLLDAADAVEEIVRIFASNYVPVRTFRGPVFLSGYGLHIDQRVDRELNRELEQVMLRLEGDRSIFDIAEDCAIEYWTVHALVDNFRSRGLVRVKSSFES